MLFILNKSPISFFPENLSPSSFYHPSFLATILKNKKNGYSRNKSYNRFSRKQEKRKVHDLLPYPISYPSSSSVPQTKTFHCEIVNTQSQFPPRFIVGAQSRNDLGSIRRAAGRVGRERRKRNLARLSKEERKKQNEAYSILLGH